MTGADRNIFWTGKGMKGETQKQNSITAHRIRDVNYTRKYINIINKVT